MAITPQGYRRVWVGKDHPLANADGTVLEHRLVLFEAGRPVRRGCRMHVHHHNGDRLDNRLENLELVSAKEHNDLHPKPIAGNQHGHFPADPANRRERDIARKRQLRAEARGV